MLLVRNAHAHAVDLHAVVGGNEQVPAPADHAGLDEIAVLRRDGDLHLRRGDLELAHAKNVLRVQRGVLAVLLLALAAEALDLLLAHTALGQDAADVADRQLQRRGVAALLVLLNAAAQLFVDGLHHIVAAILFKRISERGIKYIFLLDGGHRRLHTEYRVNDLLVDELDVPAVEKRVVDVRRAVVEGGEEEAQLGRKGNMSGGAGVEEVLVGIVAQLERRRLHRTNGADKILVDVAGGVRLQFVVLATVGDIVGVGGEENKAVRLAHIERFNNFAAERFAGVRILALRLAQGLEQAVLVAVRDLSGREFNVDEVASQRAGERLFEQPQIHLLLLLPHEAEGGVDPRDDLAVGVDIAAEDAAEVIFIEPEAPANFVEFFLIHFLLPSLTEYHGEKLYHSVPLAARGTTSIHTEKKNG